MSDKLDSLTEKMAADGRVPFSEDDLANRLSTMHVDDLRYVEDWNCWLQWDDHRWARTGTTRIFGLAREVCSHAAALCNQPSRKIASAATVAAVEKMARSDPRQLISAADLDADGVLVNTPGCVVDFCTGETRPTGRTCDAEAVLQRPDFSIPSGNGLFGLGKQFGFLRRLRVNFAIGQAF